MKKNIYLIISLIFFLFSCTKKTQVSGRALSRYHFPLKDNIIKVIEYRETPQRPYSIKHVCRTDENGYFSFTYRTRNNSKTFYVVELKSDSGIAVGYDLIKGKHNDITFIIGQ